MNLNAGIPCWWGNESYQEYPKNKPFSFSVTRHFWGQKCDFPLCSFSAPVWLTSPSCSRSKAQLPQGYGVVTGEIITDPIFPTLAVRVATPWLSVFASWVDFVQLIRTNAIPSWVIVGNFESYITIPFLTHNTPPFLDSLWIRFVPQSIITRRFTVALLATSWTEVSHDPKPSSRILLSMDIIIDSSVKGLLH